CHARWWDETLRIFAARGWLRIVDGAPRVIAEPDAGEHVWRDWARYRFDTPAARGRRAQIDLADVCVRALPDVLAGRLPAADVLFPGGSMERVEGVYRDNPISDYFNAVQADALIRHVRAWIDAGRREPIRILEVGAGTGGTTALALERLRPYAAAIGEYCFTDVSQAFLQHAQAAFGARAGYLRTALFDVERPLDAQRMPAGRYDIVIATNVLHATRQVRGALRNVKACLRAGGVLLLNEISEKSLFAHLTFGLLEGWWLHEDSSLREPGSPVLAPATWRRLLEDEGFGAIAFAARDAHALGQQVVCATSDGVIRQRAGEPSGHSSRQGHRNRQDHQGRQESSTHAGEAGAPAPASAGRAGA
ncbi:class I SAM-dependent methyltransferase, partial [Burkholderia pseudomallei]